MLHGQEALAPVARPIRTSDLLPAGWLWCCGQSEGRGQGPRPRRCRSGCGVQLGALGPVQAGAPAVTWSGNGLWKALGSAEERSGLRNCLCGLVLLIRNPTKKQRPCCEELASGRKPAVLVKLLSLAVICFGCTGLPAASKAPGCMNNFPWRASGPGSGLQKEPDVPVLERMAAKPLPPDCGPG